MFKDTTGKTISSIVINIGNPALIIASGMNPERLENKGKLLFTLGVALIYFAIMLAVAELLPRLLHADREDYGAYQVMTLFSNIGFMGYPLLDVMYGSNAIIHAVIFNLLYNVLILYLWHPQNADWWLSEKYKLETTREYRRRLLHYCDNSVYHQSSGPIDP